MLMLPAAYDRKISYIKYQKKLPEVKLKEFVGHTASQVAAGSVMGVFNAAVIYFVFLKH